MRIICLILFTLGLSACVTNPSIERTHYAEYEKQVGYTQVVKQGNRIYLSGVVAPGPDMQKAIESVYSTIQYMLQKSGATMGDVIKENLYTTDMAAMRLHTDVRKKFYPEGLYPSASWIEVKGLFMPEYILEVEVEAVISAKE